jgi:hypothetical protein
MAIPVGTLATRQTSGRSCAAASRIECITTIWRGDGLILDPVHAIAGLVLQGEPRPLGLDIAVLLSLP